MSYDALVKWRPECGQRFGTILDLPIVPSAQSECVRLYQGGAVLDVGAGVAHSLRTTLQLSPITYFSLDNDPFGEFTFKTVADIPPECTFSLIVLNQFLEHLTIAQGMETLLALRDHLAPNGRLLAAIPNAHHPVRYHADVTHLTNWPFGDFYGLFRMAGYEVESLARANKRPLTRNPLKRWIVRAACQELRIDWCDSLVLVARR